MGEQRMLAMRRMLVMQKTLATTMVAGILVYLAGTALWPFEDPPLPDVSAQRRSGLYVHMARVMAHAGQDPVYEMEYQKDLVTAVEQRSQLGMGIWGEWKIEH
jgi:hypothetical protein